MEYPKIETLYERDKATFKIPANPVIKNPAYDLIKIWQWTEKIDGTNIRAIWNNIEGKISFNGRTDNAQIPGDLIKHMYEISDVGKFKEVFSDVNVILFGEGYGAGIQKGGDYSPTKKFILFDVLIEEKWWLNDFNVRDVGQKLGLDVVPYIGTMTLEEATEMVRKGFQSNLGGGKAKAEGMVGKPSETLFDKNGSRLVVKLKTKDF